MITRVLAGELRTRFNVVSYEQNQWAVSFAAWAKTEYKNKVVYSQYAKGEQGMLFTIRCADISLHSAFRIGEQHYMLTSIEVDDRYMHVLAAAVTLTQCMVEAPNITYDARNRPVYGAPTQAIFQGVLSQKYINWRQEEPNVSLENGVILTTPKPVLLETGKVVEAGGKSYGVRQCYTMDPYHNDYEIVELRDA